MKISAMPAGAGGNPGVDLNVAQIGSDAIPTESRQDAPQSVRRLKMRTNYSTNRDEAPTQEAATQTEDPSSTKTDNSGQAQAAVESTQPLSPQFAALAKERRQLQVMKQELAKERAAIDQAKTVKTDDMISKADLIANPLKIFESGLTYDQLTEAILAGQTKGVDPERLKEEILKAAEEKMNSTLTSRAEAQEEAALNSIADEVEALSKEGDTYELIRSRNAMDKVLNKIYSHFKKTGQVLDTAEVMNQVESQLLDDVLKFANIGKVKSKFAPEPTVQTGAQSEGKQMKTLTNRDGAAVPLGRRARAIAAMNGTLRK